MIFTSDNSAEFRESPELSVIDPFRNASCALPVAGRSPWLYGAGEFECRRLKLLRDRVKAVELNVGYPGKFHSPAELVWFRHPFLGGASFFCRSTGRVTVRIDGRELFRTDSESWNVEIPDVPGACRLTIEISAPDELPGLLVEDGVYGTSGGRWEWSGDGVHWEVPAAFPRTSDGVVPHRAELAEASLFPVGREGRIHDFGREIFGRVVIRCAGKPEISVGESRAEAENRIPADREQSMEVVAVTEGVWESAYPLAFRYVRVEEAAETAELFCRAPVYPVCYRGDFFCSDPKLNRIWEGSAYTLRLCMRDFLLDGIKRDRLPWVGDLMMSLMANAYTFADAEIVRRTLTVLGRAGIADCHLNGIADYSLWWVICHDAFQRYFGDPAYLRREWPRIVALMGELEARCGSDGMMVLADGDWLFIDWVEGDKLTALQILWFWALKAGAKLAARLQETGCAEHWERLAARVASFLQEHAWDAGLRLWRGIPGDVSSRPSRHAQFLSVLSGLARPEQAAAVRELLLGNRLPPVGTPYMAGFENLALARLGAVEKMLANVHGCWGGMLDRGATTFWEAYSPDEKGDACYAFYGRPFGRSLCHAWSAGPAAFLPAGLLGLEPLTDGWERFSLKPAPGVLARIAVTVPTPRGEIEIVQAGDELSLRLPPGITAVCNGHELQGENIVVAALSVK